MSRPTFSIITVSLNQGDLLRGAIESVQQQHGAVVQHIIVDGGSTDQTEEILKEYPHLLVVRVPFLTQSQALNSGFAVATGEIVSWLSPWDRYAPQAFAHVVKEIERHPVVMGACACGEEQDKVSEKVDNVERSWFDTMKYWVANAVPMQPAVFFKRSILAKLEIEPGEVFDEGLHYAMDFDLWLRIQEHYPFSLRIPEVLAYRRRGAAATTSVDSSLTQREMSRVFRRHASRRIHPEQNFSVVVPLGSSVSETHSLLEQLNAQTLPGVEVVVVDYSGDPAAFKVTREAIEGCSNRWKNIAFQCIALSADEHRSKAGAIDAGVRAARSQVVACIDPSSTVPANFANEALRCFSKDEIGLVLPSLGDELSAQLFTTMHGTKVFNPKGAFALPANVRLDCLVRKLAWIDCGGFALHDRFPDVEFSIKRLMVMLAHKAWRIVSEPLLPVVSSGDRAPAEPFRLYENCVVVDEIAREMRRNPFSVMRSKFGFGLVLSEDIWQRAQSVIQSMPVGRGGSIHEMTSDQLKKISDQNPVYGPVLYCLAQALIREGKQDEAQRVLERWKSVHDQERSSPLYGGGA